MFSGYRRWFENVGIWPWFGVILWSGVSPLSYDLWLATVRILNML